MISQIEMTDVPCSRCLALARKGVIRTETVQPLPKGAFAPLGLNRQKCCFDCASADTLLRFPKSGVADFTMARIAVGNDRQEQYRLPGVPMGLVKAGFVRPSKPGDFEKHIAWLDENNWFGSGCEEDT
jgi:hypothetical protein